MNDDELEAALRTPRNPELITAPPSTAHLRSAVARRRRHRRSVARLAAAAAMVAAVVGAAGLGVLGGDGTAVVTGARPDQPGEPTTTTTAAPDPIITVSPAEAGTPPGRVGPGADGATPAAPAEAAVDGAEQPARHEPAGEVPVTTTVAPKSAPRPDGASSLDADPAPPARPDPLAELADKAAVAFGDRFGGVIEVDGQPTVFVKETDAELPADFEGAPVRGVRYSFAELQAAQDRVTASLDELAASGVSVAYAGTDVADNQVSVGVRTLDQEVRDAFHAVMGDGPYQLELAQWVDGNPAP